MLLIIFPVVSGCSLLTEIQKPKIVKVTPSIKGLDFKGVDMNFDIDVHNPYPVQIVSPGFDYGMNIEENRLFESQADTDVDLAAKKTGTVTLPVRLDYMETFKAVSDLATKAEANYEVFGAFHFKPFGKSVDLPFSRKGSIPVVKMPKISVKNVSTGDVGLSGATLKVDLGVKNPNIFKIGLDNLGYGLKLGDTEIAGLKAGAIDALEAGSEGNVTLSGKISAMSVISKIVKGIDASEMNISPTGSIKTKYGDLKLP